MKLGIFIQKDNKVVGIDIIDTNLQSPDDSELYY